MSSRISPLLADSRSGSPYVAIKPRFHRYNLRGDGASELEATSDWANFTIGSLPSSCHRHPIDPPQTCKAQSLLIRSAQGCTPIHLRAFRMVGWAIKNGAALNPKGARPRSSIARTSIVPKGGRADISTMNGALAVCEKRVQLSATCAKRRC